ncbi:MAG: carboxypeptidase regulatory-like domain-containing protein [Acidobacteriota bacterium]
MSISKAARRRPSAMAACLGLLWSGAVFGQPAARPIKIRGRVLPLQGASAPPSSAFVEIRPAFLSFAARRAAFGGDEPAVLASARAVGDGTFELSVPAPGCYRVTFRARGFRTLEIPLLPLVEPVELPPMVPAGLRPLSVTVLDPTGQPVAGAAVRAVPFGGAAASDDPGAWRPAAERVRTDSQGRAIVNRSAGEKTQVQAETAAGLGSTDVEADAPWAVVRLADQPALAIAARDAAGRPASGALVYSLGSAVAVLDDEGHADVLSPAPGTLLLIVTEGGAWGEVVAPMAIPVGGKPISVRLGPPRKARGRALESIDGKPLSNALAWVGGEGVALDGVVHPDDQGNFEIAVAGSGKPTFGAAAAGHAWRQIAGVVPGPRDLPVLLRLDRADPEDAAGITGILLDEAGKPVGGAEIFALRETESADGGERTTEQKEQRLATSDIHGGFHAGSLEPGAFDLIARANGFVPGRLPGLKLATGGRLPNLKVVLSRGLSIEGRLRDPQGNPAAGVTVEARRVVPLGKGAAVTPFLPPQSSFVTDRGGQFQLTGLEPGTYEVTAANGLGRAHGMVEVGAAGGRVDLHMAK